MEINELRKDFEDILREYDRQEGEFEELNVVIPYEDIGKVLKKLVMATVKHSIGDEYE